MADIIRWSLATVLRVGSKRMLRQLLSALLAAPPPIPRRIVANKTGPGDCSPTNLEATWSAAILT